MRTKLIKTVLAIVCLSPVWVRATIYTDDINWTEGHHEVYGGDTYYHINMYNNSSFSNCGADIGDLTIYDTTVADLHNGHIDELWMYNSSTFNLLDDSIRQVITRGTASLNFYDGSITMLSARENSVANIYGGQITDILGATDTSIINLYAYDIIITTSGGNYDFGQVSGIFYRNNISFCFNLGGETASHINIVPEPTTLVLFVLGGLVLKKKN